MSLYMDRVGRGLTRPTSIPVRDWGLMPSFSPSHAKGRTSSRLKSSAMGRLPRSTTPIDATTAMASLMGAMPGIMPKPVMLSTAASIRPMVTIQRMASARMQKPFTILPGASCKPTSSSRARAKTGMFWWSITSSGRPAASPPATSPTGIAARPSMTPRAKKPRSFLGIMPMPTGMVNTMVQPNMAATTTPE